MILALAGLLAGGMANHTVEQRLEQLLQLMNQQVEQQRLLKETADMLAERLRKVESRGFNVSAYEVWQTTSQFLVGLWTGLFVLMQSAVFLGFLALIGVLALSYAVFRLVRVIRRRFVVWRARYREYKDMFSVHEAVDPAFSRGIDMGLAQADGQESMQPGSRLVSTSLERYPTFQVAFYGRLADTMEEFFVGSGIYLDGFLIAPKHVVELDPHRSQGLIVRRWLRLKTGDVVQKMECIESYHPSKPSPWTEILTDAVACQLNPDMAAKLGLKKPKLGLVTSAAEIVEVIGGARVERSVGPLKAYTSLGMVQYEGSTQKGHSGSAYAVNNSVYGMHIGSWNGVNVGYEAAYLKLALSYHWTDESSDDYIFNQLRSKGLRLEYKTSPFGAGDEVLYKFGGKFYRRAWEDLPAGMAEYMDEDEESKERRKKAGIQVESAGSPWSYGDSNPFLVKGKAPSVGASALPLGGARRQPNVPPKKGLKEPGSGLPSVSGVSKPPNSTAPPESTPAQSPDPSSGTSGTISESEMQQLTQLLGKLIERLPALSTVSERT